MVTISNLYPNHVIIIHQSLLDCIDYADLSSVSYLQEVNAQICVLTR
jgi:hypothetical protein